VEKIARTTNNMAENHVAFSRKSVVFRTPITWLELENEDVRPPPFEF
jgi:hypothetical protein